VVGQIRGNLLPSYKSRPIAGTGTGGNESAATVFAIQEIVADDPIFRHYFCVYARYGKPEKDK
jgi:hypothetical protein